MPRKREIEQHPKKREIVQALIDGVSYRDIEGQYQVSRQSLSTYLRKELSQKVALVKREEDILDGTFAIQNAARAAGSLRKVLDACTRYLQDPDDPEAFNVGPRAEEVDIVVQHYDEEGKPTYTERGTLQQFLDEIHGHKSDGQVIEVKYQHEDPRRLVVNTANAINRQLGILAKIQVSANEFNRDAETKKRLVESELWQEVSGAIMDALKDFPEAKEAIGRALDRIRHTAAGG